MTSTRQEDFNHLLLILLTTVVNNNEIARVTHNASNTLEMYNIPDPVTTLPLHHRIDNSSLTLKPSDAPDDLLPIVCTSNGNCFFNAISILICGNESMSSELRVRTAIALIQLQKEFTNSTSQAVKQLIHEQAVLYAPFGIHNHRVDQHVINEHEINLVFRDELLTTLTDFAWSGMWQIIGLAIALQMPILSVYPEYNSRYRHIFNKVVLPLINLQSTMFILPIMWTGYIEGQNFKANHFVPLVPRHYLFHEIESTVFNHNTSNFQGNKHTGINPKVVTTEIHETLSAELNTSNTNDYTSFNVSKPNALFLQFTNIYNRYCVVCQQRLLTTNPKVFKDKIVCSLCYRHLIEENESPLDTKYMFPGEIPEVILQLNSTEIKMISQVHPYMNMLFLPSGGQLGLKGQSINIPIPTQYLCTEMPRTNENMPFVKIYSNKKDNYYEIVNIIRINKALNWFKEYNGHYHTITLIPIDTCDIQNQKKTSSDEVTNKYNHEDINVQELSFIPIDYQIELNSTNIDFQYRMPMIKEQPVNIFNSIDLEELAFPHLYPFGTHGLRHDRPQQPTIAQYFKCRLLNKDNRWSSSPQYIFWALHIYEQHKLQDAISTAMRKKTNTNRNISIQDIGSAISVENKTDNYMFMKSVRGTAAYWRNELSKLMAKIRTLGPPTFFLSLSANDIHWIDNIKFINPLLKDEEIANMTFLEKAKLLRDNPIASSIHFKNRWEAFLYHYLLQKPYPLGYITDYFARIEFQVRGSPHLHILLWIADAPSLENLKDQIFIVPFIDKYISATIPNADNKELHSLVQSLQIHTHTKTCQKFQKVVCRFDFPMPISENTRIKTESDTGSKSRFYILKRSKSDIYINPYNNDILVNWQANMDIQFVGSMYAVAKYVCAYICKNEPTEFRQKVKTCVQNLPLQCTQRKMLSKLGNILLTHRTISLQETAFRILGLNMVYSSRDSIYVDVNLPEERYRILRPKKELEQLSENSTNIYSDGIPQYYVHRPKDEKFAHMCLAEFASKYKLTSVEPKSPRAKPRYKISMSGKTKLFMERSKIACIRCNIPDILKCEEGYYYSLLYLFLPFYNDTEILLPYKTYMESFFHKRHLLNQQLLHLTNMTKKFDQAVQHLLSLDDDVIEDIACVTAPSNQLMNSISIDEGHSEVNNVFSFELIRDSKQNEDTNHSDFNMDMFKKLARVSMTEEEYREKTSQLTNSQRHAFEYITTNLNKDQKLTLFITGGAGTGKSFLLRLLREYFLQRNSQEFPNVLVAAPTGVAAFNINGHTLHTLLQLPTQDKCNARYRPLSAKSYKFLSETFKNVQCLIIDEISMVSYNTLQHIHLRLNELKGNYLDSDTYFGNIHIIAFGDLYQLPPVFGSAIYSDSTSNTPVHLWKDFFSMFELTENKRQCKDPEYASLLNRIRTGEQTIEDINKLSTRLVDSLQNNHSLHIYPTKNDRDIYNNQTIERVGKNQEVYKISAIHNYPDKYIPNDDQKCAGLPRTLTLCNNARVMLIRNISTTTGLVNGAQGTVHSIEWAQNDKTMPRCVNVVFDHNNVLPGVVQNNNEPIGIKPLTASFLGNYQTYVTRCQIPLVLSFATTIHKVQGLTLESAVCDIGTSIFKGGMAYVALSRVSKIQHLYLKNLCPPRIYPSATVTEEMERLRKKTNN